MPVALSVARMVGVSACAVPVMTDVIRVGATAVWGRVGMPVGVLPRGTVAVGMRVGCSVGAVANGIVKP